MSTQRGALFDVEAKERWTGSRALVPIDRNVCPACSTPTEPFGLHQPALFRHGGYGATRSTESVSCPSCGWHLEHAVTETRP